MITANITRHTIDSAGYCSKKYNKPTKPYYKELIFDHVRHSMDFGFTKDLHKCAFDNFSFANFHFIK